MKSKLISNSLLSLSCAAALATISSCGAINKITHQDEKTNSGTPTVSELGEFWSKFRQYFSPATFHQVKTIETTDENGIVVEREVKTYQGDEELTSVSDGFGSDGRLTHRYTYYYRGASTGCEQSTIKSVREYFPANEPVERTEKRNTRKCDADRRTLESHEFTKVDNKPEVETDSSIYTLNANGDEIREVRSIKSSDGRQGDTTVIEKTYDAQGHRTLKLTSKNGKPTEKVIYDDAAGTDQTFVASADGSGELNKESDFDRDLPSGQRSFLGRSAERRINSEYESSTEKCQVTGELLKCLKTEVDPTTKQTTDTIESVSKMVLVSINSTFAKYYPEYIHAGKGIMGYVKIEETKKTLSKDGSKQLLTTTKSNYNDLGHLIHEETSQMREDGSLANTTVHWTYDLDGSRPLTSTEVNGSGKKTVKYTY